MKKELINRLAILVRFNEADPLGIVWHGHYIRYFEDGREAFGKDHGLGYMDICRRGFITPVVSVQCDYKKPLRFGESVIVETTYVPCEAARIKFTYRLYNADTNELVAVGSSVQVFLDKAGSVLQLNNPPFFEVWKQQHALI